MIDPFGPDPSSEVPQQAPAPVEQAPVAAPMPQVAAPVAPMTPPPRMPPVILRSGRGETKSRLSSKFKEVAKAYMAGQQSAQAALAPPQGVVQ